jgi:hypothetical protein
MIRWRQFLALTTCGQHRPAATASDELPMLSPAWPNPRWVSNGLFCLPGEAILGLHLKFTAGGWLV